MRKLAVPLRLFMSMLTFPAVVVCGHRWIAPGVYHGSLPTWFYVLTAGLVVSTIGLCFINEGW